VCLDFCERGSAGKDHGEDVQFADTPGNELRILRTKIKDNDCLGVHFLLWQQGTQCGKSFVRAAWLRGNDVFRSGLHIFLLTGRNMCVLTYRKWTLTYRPDSTH
jgi:hypothetical protein